MIEDNIKKVWQITEFTKELNERAAEKEITKTSYHYNTIDSWFKELEKEGGHYISRIANKKVYTEEDIEIGLLIMRLREEGWNLKGIYNQIKSSEVGREYPESFKNDEESLFTEEEVREIVSDEMEKQKALFKNEFLQLFEEREKELIQQIKLSQEKNNQLLLEQEERKQDSIKEYFNLVREAEEEWSKEPATERLIKVGFFAKVEDIEKKNKFIEEYIKKRLSQ